MIKFKVGDKVLYRGMVCTIYECLTETCMILTPTGHKAMVNKRLLKRIK